MYRRYYSGYENDLLKGSIEDIGLNKPMSLASSDKNMSDDANSIINSHESEISVMPDDEISVSSFNNNILGPLAIDDIILIGILLLLVHEQCDDTLMLVIVGFILLTGFII